MNDPEPAPEDADPALEHDVLVTLRLSNQALGTAAERADLENLADELADAVAEAGAGEFDGDELGGGECVLFFAGPDADRLFAVLQPILRRHPQGRTATVVLQYGSGEPVTKRVGANPGPAAAGPDA